MYNQSRYKYADIHVALETQAVRLPYLIVYAMGVDGYRAL